MLEEIRQTYLDSANRSIPKWQEMNKNDLANLYIKNENNPILKDAYFSALMLRYWGNIGKHYVASKSSVEIDECYNWLVEAIMLALKERKWLEKGNKLYGDPAGPDKVINRCIYSMRMGFYQYSNCDKRKINYNTSSIDYIEEQYGTSIEELFPETFLDPAAEASLYNSNKNLIQYIQQRFIDKKEYINFLILDAICFQDSIKHSVSNEGEAYAKFNINKIPTILTNIDLKYIKELEKRYNINEEYLNEAITDIKGLTSSKISTRVKKLLQSIQTDDYVRGLLCS